MSFSSISHMPIGSQFANFPIRCNRTLNISSYAKKRIWNSRWKQKKHNIAHVYYKCYTSWPAFQSKRSWHSKAEDSKTFACSVWICLKLRVWQNEIAQLLCCLQMRHSTKHPIFPRTGFRPAIDKKDPKFRGEVTDINHQVLKGNHQVKKVKKHQLLYRLHSGKLT